MSLTATAPHPDLNRSLGESGQKEYRRLCRVVCSAAGRFSLFPVESDFRPATRTALLERIEEDLRQKGLRLRIIQLGEDEWDIVALLEREPVQSGEVLALLGLENTPGMAPVYGSSARPPAIAILNHAREGLRRRLPGPVLVWCDPVVYTSLQEHAPDFFDHYTALFTFLDAVPPPLPARSSLELEQGPETLESLKSPGYFSPAALAFYEEQVARFSDPGADRARALSGLALALSSVPGSAGRREEALERAREATDVYEQLAVERPVTFLPDLAMSLNNLAGLYFGQGNYASAEPLFRRALEIREKTLGPEHPDTAASLNNLAALAEIRVEEFEPSTEGSTPK